MTTDNFNATRRGMLAGAGRLGFYGIAAAGVGAALGAPAHAQAAAGIGDAVLTILYPREDGATFDIDYYRDNHLTLIKRLYGDSIRRFELIQPVQADGAPPSAWFAVINIYIADQETFAAAGAEHGGTLRDDVPNFSSVLPQVTNGVLYGLG
jgi:uncharacterized protein (TIGR02118 family)